MKNVNSKEIQLFKCQRNIPYNIIAFISFFLFHSLIHAQQLPNRSLYDDIGFIWNPAETGKNGLWSVALNHGQEWTNFENAPIVSSIGFQKTINSKEQQNNSSLGFFIQNYVRGPIRNTNIYGSYSYKFRPNIAGNEDQLSLGIQVGLLHTQFSNNNLVAFDGVESDSRLINFNSVSDIPTLGIGLYYRSTLESDRQKNHIFLSLASNQLVSIYLNKNQKKGILPEVFSNGYIGYRKQLKSINSFIEPSVQMIFLSQNISNLLTRFSVRYEKYDKWWLIGLVGSNLEVGGGGGYIFNSNSLLGSAIRGNLKIGGYFRYHTQLSNSYIYPGFEFYLGYQAAISK